jgi:DNA invertase Pin-like site-specific DNA recombinase
MDAILIVRVSTDKQGFNSQIEDLKLYAKSKGYNKFHIINSKETGLADINNRDGLNELFSFIKENKNYNTVFVTELSRLGRRQSVLQFIKEWFIQNKIQLIVKDTEYSLFKDKERLKVNGNAEIMFTLYALFAESEIKSKKDRFARKRRELMASGNSFYGGKVLFGYELKKINQKNKLIKNEENAETIRKIFNWYLFGIDELNKNPSILKITRECIRQGFHPYTHSKRNVNKLLKEEGYCGRKITDNRYKNVLFGKKDGEVEYIETKNEIKYPQIIDIETFERVQTKISLKITDKKTKHTTILSNLITCNNCGRKLSANYRSKTNSNSYRCTSRSDTKTCLESIKSVSMNFIDNLIWNVVKLDKNALINKIKELNPNVKLLQINNEIKYLEIKKESLINDAELIKKIFKNLNLSNISVEEIINTNSKKLATIDKKLADIDDELLILKGKKIRIEIQYNNRDFLNDENLEKIENDVYKIKEFINHFIKEI